MMLNLEVAQDVCDVLVPDDFATSAHRQMFEAAVGMVARNELPDTVAMMQALKARRASSEELMRVRDYAENVVTTGGARHHARKVREASTLRRVILAANEVIDLAYDADADPRSVIGKAEGIVFNATDRDNRGVVTPWSVAVSEGLDRLEYMSQVENPVTGVPTGYEDIDFRFGGLQPASLYLVAARPSVGKTAFVCGLANHAARHGKVAFFSLEMSPVELGQRQLCAEAGVSMTTLRNNGGKGNPEDWQKIMAAHERLSGLPINVYDQEAAATAVDIAAKARREKDLSLIVIDYVQLMRHHRRVEKRQEEVSEISRSLKLLARELHVPIVACAQLNRELEQRGKNARPQLSDLRDSGSLEQDADVVIFLHRMKAAAADVVEAITAKNRNGPTGTDKFKWIAALTRFEPLSYQERLGLESS